MKRVQFFLAFRLKVTTLFQKEINAEKAIVDLLGRRTRTQGTKKIPIKNIRRILNHSLQDNGFIGPEHEYTNMECLPFGSLLSLLNFIVQDLKSEGGNSAGIH